MSRPDSKSLWCDAWQSIASQLWRLFCSQGIPGSGCALFSVVCTARAHDCYYVLNSAYHPAGRSGPGFCRISIFAYRPYNSFSACHESNGPRLAPSRHSVRWFQPVPGTLPRLVLHEWDQRTQHSYRWRVPSASESRNRIPSALVSPGKTTARVSIIDSCIWSARCRQLVPDLRRLKVFRVAGGGGGACHAQAATATG